MNDFFRKEKIKATLIHPEKEKFPCSAETGDVDRHHPRRRPDGMPEAGGQMFVPLQGSLLDSSALSHVSTRARAHHRQAPRLLARQQRGVWGWGGAAGTGCPIGDEMGLRETRER